MSTVPRRRTERWRDRERWRCVSFGPDYRVLKSSRTGKIRCQRPVSTYPATPGVEVWEDFNDPIGEHANNPDSQFKRLPYPATVNDLGTHKGFFAIYGKFPKRTPEKLVGLW